MKILITGSRGFIGGHLAEALESKGHRIVHYDLKDGNDILDLPKLEKYGEGVEGVVHFAALQRVITGFRRPFDAIEHNIMGLSNVLRVATKNKAWVLFGSSKTVYGKPEKLPVKEEDPKNPTNIYSLSKLMSEMILKDFCTNYGLRAAVVRFSSVFGSERDLLDRAIPTFMYKAVNDIDLIVEDPQRRLEPVFIDDLIPPLVRLTEMLASTERGYFDVYNAASGYPMKISEIVNLILKITNSKAKIVGTRPPRSYDFGDYNTDNHKFKTLGYKMTPIEAAMEIYYKRMVLALQRNVYRKEEIEEMMKYHEKRSSLDLES